MAGLTVWTVGHSTHGAEDFLAILRGHGIEAIADVRRFPGSRRHPHFGRDALRALLAATGIEYHEFPDLGGRRTPRSDSHNSAWRNAAFRGYADYMETDEFTAAMERLERLAAERALPSSAPRRSGGIAIARSSATISRPAASRCAILPTPTAPPRTRSPRRRISSTAD